jgi:uncharacterized protein involved in response to NO
MFLTGAVQALVGVAWWAFDLAGRFGLLYAPFIWPLPSGWIHGALMIYGVFPFFIFGFLMTAGPRWAGAAPVSAAGYLLPFVLMATGWAAFHVALWLPVLLVPALGLVLAGWCAGLPALARVLRAPRADRLHLGVAVTALGTGALGLAGFLAAAAGGAAWLAHGSLTLGVWLFLLPVLSTVCHRMIPFFTSVVVPGYRVVRPTWALLALLGGFTAHALLVLAGLPQWAWLADAPAAAVAVALTLWWRLDQSLAERMLAALHIPFAWLGLSLTLFAAHSLLLLAGEAGLGLAPLHALTLGFFASLLVGMASRVTLGHSGRSVASDAATWAIFWGLQAVALVRVAGEFLSQPGPLNLSLLAALGWLAVFGGWFAKYAPAYVRPRPDGRAG